MLFFWSFSVLNEKKPSPYATEEYLFMPTITAHPRTDCLNRSANNWRISKLFNTFMTTYTVQHLWSSAALPGERWSQLSGVESYCWALPVCITVFQNKALNLSIHLCLTSFTWRPDKSAYWLSKLQTVAGTLKETFRCLTSRTSSVWRYDTQRRQDWATQQLLSSWKSVLSWLLQWIQALGSSIVLSSGI